MIDKEVLLDGDVNILELLQNLIDVPFKRIHQFLGLIWAHSDMPSEMENMKTTIDSLKKNNDPIKNLAYWYSQSQGNENFLHDLHMITNILIGTLAVMYQTHGLYEKLDNFSYDLGLRGD